MKKIEFIEELCEDFQIDLYFRNDNTISLYLQGNFIPFSNIVTIFDDVIPLKVYNIPNINFHVYANLTSLLSVKEMEYMYYGQR